MKKIKLYLFKKLFIWWLNNYGNKVRGTQSLEEIMQAIYGHKN